MKYIKIKKYLNTIRKDGIVLKYVNKKIRNNKKIVLNELKNNGLELQYVNKRLKNNKNIVLTAVKCY